jgi:hypothetical protein
MGGQKVRAGATFWRAQVLSKGFQDMKARASMKFEGLC